MTNCIIFQQVAQRALKKGWFKLVDKSIAEMEVDTHPFQKLDINMVSYEYLATKRKKMK